MILANILVHLNSTPRTEARVALSLRIAEPPSTPASSQAASEGRTKEAVLSRCPKTSTRYATIAALAENVKPLRQRPPRE
jgi:hypothetical protein